MNKIKFGSYIKESRIKKNYTQQELADLLFVDVSTVSKWERGVSYPDITLVPDICKALDISEHELIESSHDVQYRKMQKDAKKYNNMKKGTFWTLNISYILAVLVCFVVNIAINHTLSWFFIVLTSIMCSYSFCPTITWLFNKYKKIVFIFSTFISLFLLFLTCSMYTGNYWFMIATLGVMLGYFIVFYPSIFKNHKKYLTEEIYKKFSKWFLLSYIVGIFFIINLLLVTIYLYVRFNLIMGFIITGGIFMLPITFGILNLFEISKTLTKPILLFLSAIFVVALMCAIGRSMYLKSTEVVRTYTIEESYNDIKIEGKTLDVNIHLSNKNENKIVYVENKRVTVESKIIDGVLTIYQSDNRKFYDTIFNFTSYKIDLYLAQDVINTLDIEDSTGDIKINEGFTFNNVFVNNSTGDIWFKSDVTSDLNVVNSTGDIEIKDSNVNGSINIKTKTGDVELANINCDKLDVKVTTGDIELENVIAINDFNINGSTGDVDFDEVDAANIYVTMSTGDVKGTLLSNKIFIAKSNTGKIDAPETVNGGVCKITTSTGNIKISIK